MTRLASSEVKQDLNGTEERQEEEPRIAGRLSEPAPSSTSKALLERHGDVVHRASA